MEELKVDLGHHARIQAKKIHEPSLLHGDHLHTEAKIRAKKLIY